jgi:hypothetical protein
MRTRAVVVLALLAAPGCVRGPEDPTPPPALAGRYTLVVQASPVCSLSVSSFEWEVEGTTSGVEVGSAARLTRPGGDSTVDMSLTYRTPVAVAGTMNVRLFALRDDLRVTITASAEGELRAQPGGGGRGEVPVGSLNGTIGLSAPEDREAGAKGSCTAANHRFSLMPR